MSAEYSNEKKREEEKEYVSLPCDEKVYVYYNSVRLQAMERHLKESGSSVSKELFRMLGELYHQLLTQGEQELAEKKIQEGRSTWNRLKDGSREYILIKIRERGQEIFFADDVETFYSVSCHYCEYVRRYSNCQFDQFAEALHCECVLTPREFEYMRDILMPRNLSAILQLDLDEGVAQVKEQGELLWHIYSLEGIFDAAFSAEFSCRGYLLPNARLDLFREELEGKELSYEELLINRELSIEQQ